MESAGAIESIVKSDEVAVLEFPALSVKETLNLAFVILRDGTLHDFVKGVLLSGPVVDAVVPTVDQVLPLKKSMVKFSDVVVFNSVELQASEWDCPPRNGVGVVNANVAVTVS